MERYAYEYVRKGVADLFLFSEPLRGWRTVQVTDRRTKRDWAHAVRVVVEEQYPEATCITLVCDNLNTHTPGALYEAFPPEEARRLLDRLDIRHTPKHGSWLNVAEIELSVLSRQCLADRIPGRDTLVAATTAWCARRNTEGKLWELRRESNTNIYRVIYFFFTGKRIVFVHGFQKKDRKTPWDELAIAHARYAAFMKREGGE